MNDIQELLHLFSSMKEVLLVVAGGVVTIVGSVVTGLITSRIQDQRIQYEERVRIDQLRRDRLGRFDDVRRETYGRFIGSTRRFYTDISKHAYNFAFEEYAAFRENLVDNYIEIRQLHGEVSIVGSTDVLTWAHRIEEVVAELLSEAERTPFRENKVWYVRGCQRWFEDLDEAQQGFISAVRSQLDIVEIRRDPAHLEKVTVTDSEPAPG